MYIMAICWNVGKVNHDVMPASIVSMIINKAYVHIDLLMCDTTFRKRQE